VSQGQRHVLAPGTSSALHEVPQTFVVSLLARHLASSGRNPVISDPAASVLLGRLGLPRLGGDWSFGAVVAAAAVRTSILDAAVRSFAEASQHSTLVTVGAGLCTRCVRLRDLDADWIDIDLPEVAALRSVLLPPAPNRIVLGESVLDSGWLDRVAGIAGPRLFVLEGLTMYLEEDAVRDVITGLADRCPGSHLLVDTAGPPHQPSGRYRQLSHAWRAENQFRWGVRDLSELATWHPRLHLVETWHLMDYYPAAWPLPLRALRRIPSVRVQAKMGHFRVSAALRGSRPPEVARGRRVTRTTVRTVDRSGRAGRRRQDAEAPSTRVRR
jgi:O-methyltransferase involved in polyketide biosynthesis